MPNYYELFAEDPDLVGRICTDNFFEQASMIIAKLVELESTRARYEALESVYKSYMKRFGEILNSETNQRLEENELPIPANDDERISLAYAITQCYFEGRER